MSQWRSVKARAVFAAPIRIGYQVKQEAAGSQKILSRNGSPNFVFAFHDRDEIGPHMLSMIAKHAGLTPEDL